MGGAGRSDTLDGGFQLRAIEIARELQPESQIARPHKNSIHTLDRHNLLAVFHRFGRLNLNGEKRLSIGSLCVSHVVWVGEIVTVQSGIIQPPVADRWKLDHADELPGLFRAGDMTQALRAEYALETHGLPVGK